MAVSFSRGFHGRPRPTAARDRLPPGQYETRDFPVLSAGSTPRVSLQSWDFTLQGAVSVDTLITEAAARGVEPAPYVLALCDGGYITQFRTPVPVATDVAVSSARTN
jgi:hypothetical protein